jgi:electron transport complex protein RnfC
MLRTFPKGGVHPPENKISADKPIEILPLPKQVAIPVSQHIGAPAKIIVNRKDKVKVGQIIASSGGFVSANIHSSVSGTIAKIDKVFDTSGYRKDVVIIDVEGDEWDDNILKSNDLIKQISHSKEEILKKITEAGIVGLGGATFPTHVKLAVPGGKKADILIINGVECEPYLTSDHRLMMEKSSELMVGTQLLMKALGVDKAIIGIENNKPDAIEKLTTLSKEFQGIEIQALKVKYPQGGEKQLIKALINREVPSGALPIDVGAVVHNVGTAFAVYEAVQKNKPLFERVVTVTGKFVKSPKNLLVRIGTPTMQLIDAAGGLPENTGKVISGGPMMGKALNSLDAPVAKGTSGILLLSKDEAFRAEAKACIRCAKCVNVCPMGLEPFLLMTVGERKIWDRMENERVMDCIECGSCSFVCPSNRPLLDYIRLGKNKVGQIIRQRKSN